MSFHNARDTLARSIQSLRWQTYSNWELILLDDGSSDRSAEILGYIEDPRIHYYRGTVCRGLPTRLNQGIALAKGEYIARMDADDVAFPERFARQVAYLDKHREVDLLATAVLLVNSSDRPVGILAGGLSHDAICCHPWHGFPMPHPTWMGRATWFRRHRYDESARKAQDQALLYKVYRTSVFANLPDVLLGYKYMGLSVRKTILGRYYYLRAMSSSGSVRHRFLGTLGHLFAAVRDLVGLVTGMQSLVIKARIKAVDAGVLAEWDRLQLDLKLSDTKMENK